MPDKHFESLHRFELMIRPVFQYKQCGLFYLCCNTDCSLFTDTEYKQHWVNALYSLE